MTTIIAVESPLQDEVRALVAQLNAMALSLTPAEFCHHMTVEQMTDTATTLFVARVDGKAVAMGALRRDADGIAEVKRMFTDPAFRGRGLGGAILARIEELARAEGFTRLVLETGSNFDWARRLYERAGFTSCEAFLDYPASDWNAFYDKALMQSAVHA
ncbi:MAG: GNAT family N-acetyltransferase [Terricaulis sp.]